MTANLHIVDPFPPFGLRLPGMMWRYRDGWWIMLPTHPDVGTPGHPGELSWRTTDTASDGGGTWQVTGTAPDLTVTPSIDIHRYVLRDGLPVRDGSYWHGFITAGVLIPS